MKNLSRINLVLMITISVTGLMVSQKVYCDSEAEKLPKEAEVGQGYKKAYSRLKKEKPTAELLKKVISEEIAPMLNEQSIALKKRDPEKTKKAEPSTSDKSTRKGEALSTHSASRNPLPAQQGVPSTPEETAPEIDASQFPGMIIYEKGKDAVEVPQDKAQMPGEIDFSGSKGKKGPFD